MSDSTSPRSASADDRDASNASTEEPRGARLLPAIRFGLRTAVLAGIIATSSGATTGMTGSLNAMGGWPDTTCCGDHSPQIVHSQSI